jgi:hypothetical protein
MRRCWKLTAWKNRSADAPEVTGFILKRFDDLSILCYNFIIKTKRGQHLKNKYGLCRRFVREPAALKS